MTIETKYDVESRCWIMKHNKPFEVTIHWIKIEVQQGDCRLNGNYELKLLYSMGSMQFTESELSPNKKELLESL